MTSPNGGESWQIGSTQDITWDASGITNNLKIFLWKDDAEIGVIANDVDPAAGSYSWVVGNYDGGTASADTGYKIKIKEKTRWLSDKSDSDFTLTN